MTTATYNPADYPDGKGPRPDFFEKINSKERDLYEVFHDEQVATTNGAINRAAFDFGKLDADQRGLRR